MPRPRVLGPRMIAVLRILTECPSWSFAAMARDLSMSRGNFSTAQDSLIASGYLALDGRTVLIPPPPLTEAPLELTDRGRAALAAPPTGCDNVSH